MTPADKKPLSVALYGMDARSYKTMVMYLQGPCKGAAVVVEPLDAEIDIVDADCSTAKQIFEERKQCNPDRPIIAMSLENLRLENTIFLKKPVKKEEMLAVLAKARALLEKTEKKPGAFAKAKFEQHKAEKPPSFTVFKSKETVSDSERDTKKSIDEEERKKTNKHQTAKQFSEGGFSAYIGIVPEIDFDDKVQVLNAFYNPKNFYQGYVKSAYQVAINKSRVVQLNSSWKPLLILPQSHEVWLDADDKQLRAFASLAISKNPGGGMSLSPVDVNNMPTSASFENFLGMDAFLWKLALWTSKGRYPSSLDIEKPVYLKRWPNLTRLVITPHALRIAALLIREPRTLINISESLNIKPQYVFVFVSACHALDLLGQAERKADQIVMPAAVETTQSIGLFRKILSKLRVAKSD